MPYGYIPNYTPEDAYDIGYGETVGVTGGKKGPESPFGLPTNRSPWGPDAQKTWEPLPGINRDRPEGDPGVLPPVDLPKPPDTPEGEFTHRPYTWWEDIVDALKHFHFTMSGGMLQNLFELLAKGYTGYELIKALGEKPAQPGTPGGPGKGGGGGGGGGGKSPYSGASGVGVYKGLDYNPQFLAWQPTNAGSPLYSAGGPSSLQGSPVLPPPPPVKKNKKKSGS